MELDYRGEKGYITRVMETFLFSQQEALMVTPSTATNPPAQTSPKLRHPKLLSTAYDPKKGEFYTVVICDDDTIWVTAGETDWVQLQSIPGSAGPRA